MIIRNRFIPIRGFAAINLFGIIFVRRGVPLSPVLLNHERIHSRQQREMLYLGFFVWYIAEWLIRCALTRNALRAYRQISFEREAYVHDHDLKYLRHRPLFAWCRYL